MFTVQRIYAFRPESGLCAVFIDRLYPRGITKETFAAVEWLKDIAPGTALRRFYHENPEGNFAAFATRYYEELNGAETKQSVSRLLELEKAHGEVRILTAVRHPEQSHVSVLADCRFPPTFTQSDIFRAENSHKISGPTAVSASNLPLLGQKPAWKSNYRQTLILSDGLL